MDLEKLKEIHRELSMFKVVKCDMVHEKVLLSKESGLPAEANGLSTLVRRDLCHKSVRDVRLGCAHSISNYGFNKLVGQLARHHQEFEKYPSEFDGIFLKIYQIDHLKGDLEKNLAESLLEEDDSKKKASEEVIGDVVENHRSLLAQLDVLRLEVLQLLGEKILNNN